MRILITAVSLIIVLSGCSSKTAPPNYYQMDYLIASSAKPLSNQDYIWVAPVKVSDFLNSPGIVYQTSDVEYASARDNLWAVSLPEQLRLNLAGKLRENIPGAIVLTDKVGEPGATVVVNIHKFNGKYDGTAVVGGEWLIFKKGSKDITIKQFEHIITQDEDGYASLVRALKDGWDKESAIIAGELK